MKVYFVGAGPGDPELITVKGKRLLETAPVIIYAGSLVHKSLLDYAKPQCQIYNSATMTLEEVIGVIKEAVANNSWVVRLHTGDPSLFGAIQEQIELLDQAGIPYEVVPGVSSFTAAAAAINAELTIPQVSQTVIITRQAGRTPVPEGQQLSALAQHQATLCIFLSIQMLDQVLLELKTGYSPNTPVVIVEKASWPEQRVIEGTLDTISQQVAEADVRKTAMILVGDALRSSGTRSLLYHPQFTHEYRQGEV